MTKSKPDFRSISRNPEGKIIHTPISKSFYSEAQLQKIAGNFKKFAQFQKTTFSSLSETKEYSIWTIFPVSQSIFCSSDFLIFEYLDLLKERIQKSKYLKRCTNKYKVLFFTKISFRKKPLQKILRLSPGSDNVPIKCTLYFFQVEREGGGRKMEREKILDDKLKAWACASSGL